MSIRCTTSKFDVSRSSEMACYESSLHLFALGPMLFISQDGLLILICRSASKRANLVILVFYFNLPAELCYVFVALQIFYCPIGVFCILGWRCISLTLKEYPLYSTIVWRVFNCCLQEKVSPFANLFRFRLQY